ncbi:hypothetical protein G9A89_000986 [Geosiphon pyriformis]|nr:hypothetical protein G9A89_000986 [Geosiphon pyriformis]
MNTSRSANEISKEPKIVAQKNNWSKSEEEELDKKIAEIEREIASEETAQQLAKRQNVLEKVTQEWALKRVKLESELGECSECFNFIIDEIFFAKLQFHIDNGLFVPCQIYVILRFYHNFKIIVWFRKIRILRQNFIAFLLGAKLCINEIIKAHSNTARLYINA